MTTRSIVSWTASISAHTRNGDFQKALFLFSDMFREGIKGNHFTYGSVLKACTKIGCLPSGIQIQGCIQKRPVFWNLFVQSALVDLHSKRGRMEDACHLFEKMPEKDVYSWNVIIGGYTVQGFNDDAFRMFRSMGREGMLPDGFTLGNILRGSSGSRNLKKVSQVHGIIIQLGFTSDSVVTSSLVHAYAKCKSLKSANQLYKSMSCKDVISCTALLTGYAQGGSCSSDALDLFKEIKRTQIDMDDVILCSMLNICSNIASLSFGRQVHALALKHQPNFDVAMGNALVDMYAKSGELKDAKLAFDEMQEKNVISWTSLISAYAKHGYGHEALSLYQEMECKGLQPNDVTFLSLLFACSHAGLTSEGWDCFKKMVHKYNIIPRAEHYSCVIDLFARDGQLEEAYDLIGKMKIKPNASLWGAILGACSIYGNVSLGEVAAGHLFNMSPDNAANYVILSGMYSAAGLWDDAAQTRTLVEKRNLKKYPGSSFYHCANKGQLLLES